MASIRIIATPPGEAPEEIRRAWIGLVLPLHARHVGSPRPVHSIGVLTGPRGLLGGLWAVLSGRSKKVQGFAVGARESIELLEGHNPHAAAWWRQHASHLLRSGRALVFPSEVCEVVGGEADT
jgi:hypothetical protein